MTIQSVDATQLDGGLGLTGPGSDGVIAVVGHCAAGTVNTTYSYTERTSAIAAHTGGKALEAAVHHLDRGALKVLITLVSPTTAGSAAAVTRSGGTSGPVMTIAGAPYDDYVATVQITAGGAVGTAKFKYSKDGYTWSADTTVAATFVVPGTNLTWSFPAGTYVVGETYTSVCTGPLFSASDMTTALASLLASPTTPKTVHVVGSCTGADDATKSSNTATLAAALDTMLTTLATAKKWTCGVVEAPDVTDAALITAFTLTSSLGYLQIAGGRQTLLSYVDAIRYNRSIAWEYVARLGIATLSEDVSEVDPRGKFGPFKPATLAILRDERKTPGLDAARFITARTYPSVNEIGVSEDTPFLTDAITFASSISDYSLAVNRYLANRTLASYHAWGLLNLSKKLRIKKSGSTGTLDDLTWRTLEQSLRSHLVKAVGAHYSSFDVAGVKTDNLLSTRIPRFYFNGIPFLYPKGFSLIFGYVNPASNLLEV